MLNTFYENLPTTRIVQRTTVLGPGETNTLVSIAPLTLVQVIVVKATTLNATMRVSGVTEEAIPILLNEVRDGLAVDTIHLSTTAAGSVILELQGR